jgi:hypothetical protein
LPGWPGSSSGSDGAMAYLCCAICCLRLPRNASPWACPTCDRPLVRTNARPALGYRLFEITDPLPLSPASQTDEPRERPPFASREFHALLASDSQILQPETARTNALVGQVWSAGDAAGHTAPNELPLPRRGRHSPDGRPIATLKVRLSGSSAK